MEPLTWKRILAPTDLSPLAEQTVRYAHQLAERMDGELHVLHVATTIAGLVERATLAGEYDPNGDPETQSSWLAGLLGEKGNIRRVEAVRIGSEPAEKILEYARDNQMDLIVMSTHGRSALAHLWLGSVTEDVLRGTDCPVLVLRG